ncbi:AAA family ATPase [Lactococcus garvieae]|uniref:AAA family ATPase n=1 Tax=Lactococcus garvieae TaxID=1363 RepID=A0AA46TV74_9LACT|nr:AAA family ATPase [Lactococcus garvieae]UYT10105.1 AAA family ATPase [Lactococcus garvieae]UYT12134.1 AAA family ATPase [Lactococcus garvieae]
MKILTTNLNKGGVRKTTFSHNFAEWLALNGNRCLVLDTDDSRNLTWTNVKFVDRKKC